MEGKNDRTHSKSNVVRDKSFVFAIEMVQMGRRLRLDHREWVLSKQLIRSGTSIGANIEEAAAAQTKKDFLSKMSIALKEARETHYWIRILRESGLITEEEVRKHLPACQDLIRLLSSITLTTRKNLELNKFVSSRDAANSSLRISNSNLVEKHSTLHIPHSALKP